MLQSFLSWVGVRRAACVLSLQVLRALTDVAEAQRSPMTFFDLSYTT
jgi:hypothetical protein